MGKNLEQDGSTSSRDREQNDFAVSHKYNFIDLMNAYIKM